MAQMMRNTSFGPLFLFIPSCQFLHTYRAHKHSWYVKKKKKNSPIAQMMCLASFGPILLATAFPELLVVVGLVAVVDIL